MVSGNTAQKGHTDALGEKQTMERGWVGRSGVFDLVSEAA
jgi:hypothetical protein